jgi:hypothetical protein
MKSSHRRGLILLNAGLLAVLGAVTLAPRSVAQGQGSAQRARGEYTLVAGRIIGGSTHAVYIIDTANQEMVAVRWNEGQKGLDGIGYRNLAADAQAQPGR